MKWLKDPIRQLLQQFGLQVVRLPKSEAPAPNAPQFPSDFEPEITEIIQQVQPYTMTSPQRLYALIQATRYISQNQLPGDIVECGVWKGGSMLAIAQTLAALGDTSRHLYLFDTFEGMPAPSDKDRDYQGKPAVQLLAAEKKSDPHSVWCCASLDLVKQVLARSDYAPEKIHFVPGRVEDTLIDAAPERIALLRLDTDWYESTRHELEQLFPRLVRQGVLIVDDYGHWQGARLATDEFLAQQELQPFLNRIDDTGRLVIKP